MKVIATKTGFDGRKIRKEGEKFDMPEGSKASWFVPAPEDEKPEGGRKKKAVESES